MTKVLRELAGEGYSVDKETLAILSPYLTRHIKRFGDYVLNVDNYPEPVEYEIPLNN
jgi:hypothetical protein